MLERADLTTAECELWDLVATADRVDWDGRGADIRAALIYQILLGIGMPSRPHKLTVGKADIVGDLDLESAEVPFPVQFRQCAFDRTINLEQASANALYFVDCDLSGIAAGQLQTTFGFVLRKCRDTGGIVLTGAHIRGQVSFEATQLSPADGRAMTADGLVVDQDMRCSNGFVARGLVRLIGAHIGGQFQCEDGTFLNPGRDALEARGLIVDEHVYWTSGFRADGRIRLHGGTIKGELHCEGGQFNNGGTVALDFSGLTVTQDVTFTTRAKVDGLLDLTGSHIGGKLDLTGGEFRNVGATALDLARASIAQNMICQSGCDVQGMVLLAGAKIDGNLWCQGGKFDNSANIAINATGLTVGRDVAFSRQTAGEGFVANGRVILSDATIGGSLYCTGGTFTNPGAVAVTAKGLAVTRDALLNEGFAADGEVDLADATIGGSLNCGGRFEHRPRSLRCDRIVVKQSAEFGKDCYAEGSVTLRDARITADLEFTKPELTTLTMTGMTVGGTLRVRFDPPPSAEVDLSGATVGHLDDTGAMWPAVVRLDGFVYGTLPAGDSDVRGRLAWLARNPGYVPQIYLQLASVYHAAGSDAQSTKVSIAREDARRKAQTGFLGWVRKALGFVLKATVRYGYRPLQVLWFIIALEIAGSFLFNRFHDLGQLTPKSPAPDFNPILYTLDLLVPVVSLNQSDFWIPNGPAVWVSAAFTIAGWILGLCLALGVGRIFKTQ